MLHMFNLYLLLIVKPKHLLCFLPSSGSLRGSRWGEGEGDSQSCFLCPSGSVFSGRGNGSVSVSGRLVCVYTYALGCLRSCLKHVFTRHGLFTMASVYMDQRSSANPSHLSQNNQRAQDRVLGRLRGSCLIISCCLICYIMELPPPNSFQTG